MDSLAAKLGQSRVSIMPKDCSSQDFLADRGETAGEGDARSLVGPLVEQIEFGDMIMLNKISEAADPRRCASWCER